MASTYRTVSDPSGPLRLQRHRDDGRQPRRSRPSTGRARSRSAGCGGRGCHYIGNRPFVPGEDQPMFRAYAGGKPGFLALAPWVGAGRPARVAAGRRRLAGARVWEPDRGRLPRDGAGRRPAGPGRSRSARVRLALRGFAYVRSGGRFAPPWRLREVELFALVVAHRALAGRAPPARLHRRAAHGVAGGGRVLGVAGAPAGEQPQRPRELAP